MVPMQPLYVQPGAFLPMSYLPSQLPFAQEPLSTPNGLVSGGQDNMVVMSEGRNRGVMSNPAPVQPMRRMGSSNVGISNGSEAQSSLLEYMYRYGNSFSPSGTEYSVGV